MGVRLKPLVKTKWWLTGGIIIIGGALGLYGVDRVVSSRFEGLRSSLEKDLSVSLGHPLRVGPYKGLRPWGLSVGSTEVLEGVNDKSKATFASLKIAFAPIASLRNWRPVLSINPRGTNISLAKNENGSYWTLGVSNKTAATPKFAVQIKLIEPAQIRFEQANITVTATGDTLLNFSSKTVVGNILVGLPNRGRLRLKGKSRWDLLEMQASASLKKIRLNSLKKLIPGASSFDLKGQLFGDLKLTFWKGRMSCRGGMNLRDFYLKGGAVKEELTTSKVNLNCNNGKLNLPLSEWNYGAWTGSLEGRGIRSNSSGFDLGISSIVGLKSFKESVLNLSVELPLKFNNGRLNLGKVESEISLKSFPLSRASSIFGNSFAGVFSVDGQINGSLSNLQPDLNLSISNPQFNGIRLREDWKGKFVGYRDGGTVLKMNSLGKRNIGSFAAELDRDWMLKKILIKRGEGTISLKKRNKKYHLEADEFSLDGVELALPPKRRFEGIYGFLSGKGLLDLKKLSVNGEIAMRSLRFMGIQLKKAELKGSFRDKNYMINGNLSPSRNGQIALSVDGILGGKLKIKGEGQKVSARWLTLSTLKFLPQIRPENILAKGKAGDLGSFWVQPFKGSLDGQFNALSTAKNSINAIELIKKKREFLNPDDLRGDIDFLFKVQGPDLNRLEVNLQAEGKLWRKGQSEKVLLKQKPFIASLTGPIKGGEGNFSLLNIPFSLLSLLAPLPSSFNGSLGLSGNYLLRKGRQEITADLSFEDARLADNALELQRGKLIFANSSLNVDILLRSLTSKEPVKLIGSVPFKSSLPIDLRVESHGDGLDFLTGVTDGVIRWNSGTSDLRLFISGTLEDPKANGFLVVSDGKFIFKDQVVSNLETSILFDFNRLEVLGLKANIESQGSIYADGSIGIRHSTSESKPLSLKINRVRLKQEVANVDIDGDLQVEGAFISPIFSGNVTLDKGTISHRRSRFQRKPKISRNSVEQDLEVLPEQNWDFYEPILFLGQNMEESKSKNLSASIPNFSYIKFDDLMLRLGPDLRITSQPLANFRTTGFLRLNGPLDSTLKASGVIRLLTGRINLFTTTFTLDRRASNVAIFTPSLGFVPFVDIAMTSRVSENVVDDATTSSPNIFSTNGSGNFGFASGFRLVKVMVEASGPADRILETIELRSSPTMPRAQLLGLIGGNSFEKLLGGAQSEVLASVLGQSVLSPVLGSISESFSDRLHVALYPAYLTAETTDKTDDNQSSGHSGPASTSPQQAWVTEVGIDLTERFNFSVLATPNRKDIPPQGTFNFQISPNAGFVGSLDREGTWQSQLQLFFRF